MTTNRARAAGWLAALAIGGLALAGPGPARGEFALRDGDTVAFLGDSITAARTYGKIVENYTMLRFPGRTVRFFNAGRGGDTAAGGLERLRRDVLDRGATVVIVAYGINDIGWGTRADAEHRRAYLDAIRGIVMQCRARGVRVFIGSAAITAEDPDRAEHGFLQAMCDEGMAIARELGEHAIDIQRTMRSIQRRVIAANAATDPKDRVSLHAADGVHLGDLGQLAMAFAILKGLGAPAEVSSATIDASGPRVVAADGCRIANVSGDAAAGRLEFDRLDDGLPVNFGVFGALQFRYIPIPDELDRYMLAVKGLAPGRYEVRADGRALGTFTDRQLAGGLNIASATADGWEPGGPWDAEAALLIHLTDARDRVDQADRLLDQYLPKHPARGELHDQARAIDDRLGAIRRTLLSPRPFHFLVRRAD